MQPQQKAEDTGKRCNVKKKSTTAYNATVALDPAINVRALIKPSESWVKEGKQTDKLLKHEQGHFNISNVLAEKTEAELIAWAKANTGSATKCGRVQALNEAIKQWNALDSGTQLLAIWDKGEGLRKQAQKDYDDETKHGADAPKQTAWEGEITKDLPKYAFKAQP
jgi:predicted secreted Zn-dependent protease